jgi:hypothetical protein
MTGLEMQFGQNLLGSPGHGEEIATARQVGPRNDKKRSI